MTNDSLFITVFLLINTHGVINAQDSHSNDNRNMDIFLAVKKFILDSKLFSLEETLSLFLSLIVVMSDTGIFLY